MRLSTYGSTAQYVCAAMPLSHALGVVGVNGLVMLAWRLGRLLPVLTEFFATHPRNKGRVISMQYYVPLGSTWHKKPAVLVKYFVLVGMFYYKLHVGAENI